MDTATDSRPTLADDREHTDDRRAIEQVVADVETGFNGNDAELCVEHFAADASATTAMGMRISGWGTLLDMHRTGLAGPLRDEHARYVVDDVVFVRPDVALAHKRAWATDPEGELLDDEPAMRATYVLVKQDGRWWIADRSNTLIAR